MSTDISNLVPQDNRELRTLKAGWYYGSDGYSKDNCPWSDRGRLRMLWLTGWQIGKSGQELPDIELEENGQQEEEYQNIASIPRQTKRIELSSIDVGKRYRQKENYETEQLAKNIREVGILQPLAVLDKSKVTNINDLEHEDDPEKPFLLLAGGRRYYAARASGLSMVPVLVFSQHMSERDIRKVELYENIHRKSLTPAEEVALKKQIHDMLVEERGKAVRGTGEGQSVADTAKALGESQPNVHKDLEVAEYLDKIPELKNAKTKSEMRKIVKKKQEEEKNAKRMEAIRRRKTKTPAEKQKKALCDAYKVGDFFEADLPESHFHLAEIDPPYGIDYDKKRKAGTWRPKHNCYQDVAKEDWEEFMGDTLSKTIPALREHSWIIIWYAMAEWHTKLIEIVNTFDELKFYPLPAIWTKSVGHTPHPAYHLAHDYEPFLYVRKGNPAIKQQGRSDEFSYPFPSSKGRNHDNEKPVELYSDILTTFVSPGSNILVPFAGSGDSLLAAANNDMNPLGFDTEQRHKDQFDRRVWEGSLGNFTTSGG